MVTAPFLRPSPVIMGCVRGNRTPQSSPSEVDSPTGVVIFGTQSTSFRQCRAYTGPSPPISHRSQPLCGGTFRIIATSLWLSARLFHTLPTQEEFTSKAFLHCGCCFLCICPLREPPLPRLKRPFTRRETRLAFSGRFSGLRLFGFQGTSGCSAPQKSDGREGKKRTVRLMGGATRRLGPPSRACLPSAIAGRGRRVCLP